MKRFFALLLTGIFLSTPSFGQTQDANRTSSDNQRINELEEKLKNLERRLGAETLEKVQPTDPDQKEVLSFFDGMNRASEGLRFGAYGENKLRYQETPTGDKFGFDSHRVVLLGSYNFNDKILFNTEIEFEHGGAASSVGGANKAFEGGNIEVEQAYIDFMFSEHLNWRSPGIDLIPIGYINLYHEPTNFYSTERPELYRELIPSTWFEGATSLYGKVVDGLNYQFQVSMGLEDNRNTQASGTLAGGIDGRSGLRSSRTGVSNYNQSNNDLGYAFRLSYSPATIPGLAGSTSVYFTRTTPRLIPNAFVRGNSEVGMINTELRYRLPVTGLELRGEYVHVYLGHNRNLLANADGDPTNNTGNQMYGYSLESAYHIETAKFSKLDWDIVPFYRYTRVDLQTGGYQGSDFNVPTGQGDRQIHTFGTSVAVHPRVVLKADYAIPLDETSNGPNSKRFQMGVGWFF